MEWTEGQWVAQGNRHCARGEKKGLRLQLMQVCQQNWIWMLAVVCSNDNIERGVNYQGSEYWSFRSSNLLTDLPTILYKNWKSINIIKEQDSQIAVGCHNVNK